MSTPITDQLAEYFGEIERRAVERSTPTVPAGPAPVVDLVDARAGRGRPRWSRWLAVAAAAVIVVIVGLLALQGDDTTETEDPVVDPPTTTQPPTTTEAPTTTESPTTTTTTTVPPVPTTIVFERPAESIWDRLQEAGDRLSIYREAIEVAGLVPFFDDCSQDVTLFASNDPGLSFIEGTFGPFFTDEIAAGDSESLRNRIEGQTIAGAFDQAGLGALQPEWIEHTALTGEPIWVAGNDPSTAPSLRTADPVDSRTDLACNGVLLEITGFVGF